MLEANKKPRMNVDECFVKTATVIDLNSCVKANMHMYVYMYIAHTHSMLPAPLSNSYTQMRENEMRWKSKAQTKPSMESVGQSAHSSISMTWSLTQPNVIKPQPPTPSHYSLPHQQSWI